MDRTAELEGLVGTCDVYKVVSVIDSGAFAACGKEKDLFIPIGEQLKLMKVGESHLIYVYRDEKTGRIAGSSKLNKYLYDDAPDGAKEGDEVDLIIYCPTEMGFKAVVNHDTWGLLYKNEIFQDLRPQQKLKGFIKKVRPDGKIDLILQKPGGAAVADLAGRIMAYLQEHGATAPLNDKTPPEEIYRLFGVSKKKFKMAVGGLYKKRLLTVTLDAIKLAKPIKER